MKSHKEKIIIAALAMLISLSASAKECPTALGKFWNESEFLNSLKNAIETQTTHKIESIKIASKGGFAGESHWGLNLSLDGYDIPALGDYEFDTDVPLKEEGGLKVKTSQGNFLDLKLRIDDWTICENDQLFKSQVKISNQDYLSEFSLFFIWDYQQKVDLSPKDSSVLVSCNDDSQGRIKVLHAKTSGVYWVEIDRGEGGSLSLTQCKQDSAQSLQCDDGFFVGSVSWLGLNPGKADSFKIEVMHRKQDGALSPLNIFWGENSNYSMTCE